MTRILIVSNILSALLSPFRTRCFLGKSADLDTQRCIAYAICNLAVDPIHRGAVVEEGGLPPIISLACSNDVSDVRTAVATLRGLASAPAARRHIVVAGVFEALGLAACRDDDKDGYVKQEVAACFNYLSLNEENKLDIAKDETSLDLLVALTKNDSVPTLCQVYGALANLFENNKTHLRLLEAGRDRGFAYLTDLVIGTDLGMLREVVRAIANLAGNHASHISLLDAGAHTSLAKVGHRNHDALVLRFVTIALANLSANKATHEALVTATVQRTLAHLACGVHRTCTVLPAEDSSEPSACSGTRNGQWVNDAAGEGKRHHRYTDMKAAHGTSGDSIADATQSEIVSPVSLGYDVEARRYACLALGNLLSEEKNHKAVLQAGALEALVDSMSVVDAETRFDAVYACNNMATRAANHTPMALANIVGPLILLAGDADVHAQCYACACLRNLCADTEYRSAVIAEGGLIPLTQIAAKVDRLETQREVAACLCNLGLNDTNRTDMVLSGAVAPLIKLAQSSDVEISRFSLGAIANVAEDAVTHRALSHHLNGMHCLIYLMRSRHVSVHREATRAISNLLSSQSTHSMFVSDDGLRNLLVIAASRDTECLHNAALCFRKLSSNIANHGTLIGSAGLQSLIRLAAAANVPTQCQATAALRDLASNQEHKVTFAEEGGLRCLISVAQIDNIQLKVLAIGALRHLSLNTRIKRAIVREGALGPVRDCLMASHVAEDDKEVHESSHNHQPGTIESLDTDLLGQCASLLANLAEDTHNQVVLVQDGAFRLLVKMSRVSSAVIQTDVSRCLCSISANPYNQVDVFGSAELRALLVLAKHDEESVGRDAAIAIGNLAIVTRNKLLLVELGAFKPLINMLGSSFTSCQIFAARAICRLATHQESRVKVMEAGGIQKLIELCEGPDPEVRRFAAMALCNVCIDEQNKLKLVKLDGLRPLIKMLEDGNPENCRRYAAMTLSNLTNENTNREHLVRHGVIAPLIRLASAADATPECARFAGVALCNLATSRHNRIPLVRAGVLDSFIHMARPPRHHQHRSLSRGTRRSMKSTVDEILSESEVSSSTKLEVQRSGALGLYNISSSTASQVAMVRAGAAVALVELCGNIDLDCKRFALMAVANLAANVRTRLAVTKGGGLQAVLTLLKDKDINIRRAACVALGNMAVVSKSQIQIIVHGGLPQLLKLATDPVEVDSQRHALIALVNLSSNEANHSALAKKHALSSVMRLTADATDPVVREYATFNVANLSTDPDLLAQIGRAGGIAPLVKLATSENFNSQCLALAALRRLTNEPENRERVVESGGLVMLATAGLCAEVDVQREIAAALCNTTLESSVRSAVANLCLPGIVQIAQSGDREAARQAVAALANIAEDVTTHDIIALRGGTRCVIALVDHDYVDVHREASRAVANLLTSFEHQAIVIAGGLPSLIHLALGPDAECQYNAALSFRNLTPNKHSHDKIVRTGGVEALLTLLNVRDSKEVPTRQQAATALRDLAANPMLRLTLAEKSSLEAMVRLSGTSRDSTLQMLATATLRHHSIVDELKRPVVEHGALPVAVQNAMHKNEDLQCQIAGLFANLSENLENQIDLVSSGAIPVLAELSHIDANLEIQQDCARALANICSNEANHVAAYRQGALHSLVHITLKSHQDVTQRYAAMGLRFLSVNPEVRLFIVHENLVGPFLGLAKSPLLEYQRTAVTALASMTLNAQNKAALVRQGGLRTILDLCLNGDLQVTRDGVFALANLADEPELHSDLLRDSAIAVLVKVVAKSDDARVHRDVARMFACVVSAGDPRCTIHTNGALQTLLRLARSLDVACQRYSTLALCNLSCGEYKADVVNNGTLQSLSFLARFPDLDCQRYATLAIAGLALGERGNKVRIIEEGAGAPIVDLIRFPEGFLQHCAALALNAIALGESDSSKVGIAREGGLNFLLKLVGREPVSEIGSDNGDTEDFDAGSNAVHIDVTSKQSNVENKERETPFRLDCQFAAVYALGSLAENPEVMQRLVDLGAIRRVAAIVSQGNVEVKRAAAYFFARLAENVALHATLDADDAVDAVIFLAALEDTQCQEIAAFALAHLASDRGLQVRLVQYGALRPLVAMMGVQTSPRHYAGLALLKLADNFNNHATIATEGGIQALLRLGRQRGTDSELQHKAILTVGNLAANAVGMLPGVENGTSFGGYTSPSSEFDLGPAVMLKSHVSTEEGCRAEDAPHIIKYLENSVVSRSHSFPAITTAIVPIPPPTDT